MELPCDNDVVLPHVPEGLAIAPSFCEFLLLFITVDFRGHQPFGVKARLGNGRGGGGCCQLAFFMYPITVSPPFLRIWLRNEELCCGMKSLPWFSCRTSHPDIACVTNPFPRSPVRTPLPPLFRKPPAPKKKRGLKTDGTKKCSAGSAGAPTKTGPAARAGIVLGAAAKLRQRVPAGAASTQDFDGFLPEGERDLLQT